MTRPFSTHKMLPDPKLKVQVWIYFQAQSGGERYVLLLKTHAKRGSFWQPVTGGVEADEALEAAALREAVEETGLRYTSLPGALDYEFSFESRFGPAHEVAFSLRAPTDLDSSKLRAALKLDPSEHQDAQWVKPKEAMALVKHESNLHALRLLMKKWEKS